MNEVTVLLDHPELHDEIDVTRRPKQGLGSLRAKGELRREPTARGSPVLVQSAVGVLPDEDGLLSVYPDPRAAGAGSYVLRVLGHGSAQGYSGEYALALK